MIGQVVTDDKGYPIDNGGKQLAASRYKPPKAIMELFARCQKDYGIAWRLQHRSFDEFDGLSLLDRARLDQQTFGAYVGAQWIPAQKRWRWRGRTNTARNKIIGILAQIISATLIPTVYATDAEDNDSQISARAMRILLEEHLRKAKYEVKFMYMVLSALVNPATFVHVEFIRAFQRVKVQLSSGKASVEQAVDDIMSGLNMSIVPIDELMLGDFFTFEMQRQPYLVRVRRISWDEARSIYSGKYFDKASEGYTGDMTDDGMVDRFGYVEAGKTRVFMASQENQTLYDIDWTEADPNMVQVATFYYRGEDLQVDWVGGVFMGNYDDTQPEEIYNLNPFEHRRMSVVGNGWGSIPLYPYAKSGFEPLDPQMRFAYFKSAAFKEFWNDATLNMAKQLLVDGMHLDVIKPILISGISKYDSSVMTPGAVAALPKEAVVSPYQLGPNLAAASNVINQEADEMSDSTISPVLEGNLSGVKQSAFAIQTALTNAKRLLSVFGLMISDLVTQVGELAVDTIVMNTTVGELNEQLPGALGLSYTTLLIRGKENGRNVNHKIVFTDRYIGKKMTEQQIRDREWQLYYQGGGGKENSTKIWEINPYQFARKRYSCFVDPDEFINRSTGADRTNKMTALNILTDPRVAPYTDPEAVINDFAIEEYGGNDPDKYKKKGSADALMGNIGATLPGQIPGQPPPAIGQSTPAAPVEAAAPKGPIVQ